MVGAVLAFNRFPPTQKFPESPRDHHSKALHFSPASKPHMAGEPEVLLQEEQEGTWSSDVVFFLFSYLEVGAETSLGAPPRKSSFQKKMRS